MSNFFSSFFWFDLRPDLSPAFMQFILVIVVITILVALQAHARSKQKDRFRTVARKLRNFGVSNSIIGLLWWLFAYEAVPLLSSRFWYVLWFGLMIIEAIRIFMRYREATSRASQAATERVSNKYKI